MGYIPCNNVCSKCGATCTNNYDHLSTSGATHSCGH